jgi:Ala-tRNA(Pro) deacylase
MKQSAEGNLPMTIAPTLRAFLEERGVTYEIVEHAPTSSAIGSATAAHIPPSCVAKAVLLDLPREQHDHLVALLASDRRLELDELGDALGEKPELAREDEITALFDDCAPGAVPPGFGYGVDMIVDEQLMREPDIFFEGGDHCSLIHIEQAEFNRLTQKARRGSFAALSLDS